MKMVAALVQVSLVVVVMRKCEVTRFVEKAVAQVLKRDVRVEFVAGL